METKKDIPVIKDDKNQSGTIPSAIFIESAEDFCKEHGVEPVVQALSASYNKFKFTEGQFTKYRESMNVKIPEIEKAIKLIENLKDSDDGAIQTKFSLTDGLYTEAECSMRNVVYLWLGANTIVEYNYEEALELLNRNLANARKNKDTYEADLEYIKDQITIMEVNFARVHNYRVAVNKSGN